MGGIAHGPMSWPAGGEETEAAAAGLLHLLRLASPHARPVVRLAEELATARQAGAEDTGAVR